MKKILIIIGNLKTGGAEKITVDLIENMDRENLKFYFLVFGNNIGNYEEKVEKMGGEIIHVACPSFPYLKYRKDMGKIWRSYGPFDVVHTHTLLNNGVNCKIFHDLGCKKLMSHSHSTESNRKRNIITRIYEVLMKTMIKKYATVYLACGVEAGEYLYGKNLFQKKGMVICNGVNFEDFRFAPEVRKQLRSQMKLEDTYVIGHVARLAEVKNHKFALEILSKLKQYSIKYKYIIVGDGPNKEKIENEIKKLNLEESVMMLGNREDVSLLQNIFDLVLYPSFYEGVPVALVEAQVNGIPCIVSENVSKEVRIREKTKFISLKRTAEEWAEEIRVYQKISREQNPMLERGKKYDIKISAEKLRKVYVGE